MNLKPSENTRLYGMNNFFKEIISLYDEKKCQQKFYYQAKGV